MLRGQADGVLVLNLSVEPAEVAAEAGFPQQQHSGRRLLISFPESEAYLEKLRREALMIGCC